MKESLVFPVAFSACSISRSFQKGSDLIIIPFPSLIAFKVQVCQVPAWILTGTTLMSIPVFNYNNNKLN